MKAKFRKNDMIFEVEILDDDFMSVLDSCEVTELQGNPLPISACWDERSPFDYTDFAIDNYYHDAYFSTPDQNGWSGNKRYFKLHDGVKETQAHFSKVGYAKHDAWLKAIKCLKSQADYIRQFIAGDWRYVGITLSVKRTMPQANGLVWSADISSPHCDIWGVEWHLCPGGGYIDQNVGQIREILPDLLPDGILLTDEDIQEIISTLNTQ